jgi:putative transposase
LAWCPSTRREEGPFVPNWEEEPPVFPNREISVSKAVNILKSNSSKWMRAQAREFAWQQGYAAFSVSTSGLDAVIDYIRRQPEHHKKRDFAQEYLALLKKHGVQYDPEWVLG